MVDEYAIGGVEASVIFTVYGEDFAADPDIGVAAGSVAPDGLAVLIGQTLRFRGLDAIAIGDDNRMAAG
jgi:hypothetical protein